jgi:hypothetical protein
MNKNTREKFESAGCSRHSSRRAREAAKTRFGIEGLFSKCRSAFFLEDYNVGLVKLLFGFAPAPSLASAEEALVLACDSYRLIYLMS